MSEPQIQIGSPLKKKTSTNLSDFDVRDRIGKGAYGDVYLAVKKSDQKMHAIKQIQKRKLTRMNRQYQAMIQKELLNCMKHPGIISLNYAFQDKQALYFVLQFCDGGEFVDFIKMNINMLTEELRIFYIAEMVNLLEYLHTNGITHRDLKPQNLMLDKRGHLKLIDFGTAQITNCKIVKPQFKERILSLKQNTEQLPRKESQQVQLQEIIPLRKRKSTFVGTCYYISPELLEQNYCPPSADLWALGCIIYQLYYHETPFKDNTQFGTFEKIKTEEVTFAKNDALSNEAIDLIKQLLIKDPNKRLGSGANEELSYAKLKSHPYFRGLDINNIFSMRVPFIANLHEPEKTQEQKLQTQLKYNLFQQKSKDILQEFGKQNKPIIKYSILQQKSFVYYNYALLVLCQDKQLYLIHSQEPEVHLKIGEKTIRLLYQNKFQVQTEQRLYHFRTHLAEEWVTAIQSSQ